MQVRFSGPLSSRVMFCSGTYLSLFSISSSKLSSTVLPASAVVGAVMVSSIARTGVAITSIEITNKAIKIGAYRLFSMLNSFFECALLFKRFAAVFIYCFVVSLFMTELSVVIPVFNEEGSVAKLHAELVDVLVSTKLTFEIIFVDDCSSDGTLSVLQSLSPVTIVSLARNTGQSSALKAGFDVAKGSLIVSLDGDGQNPPSEIPKLLKYMDEGGFDVVSGWRKDRKDSLFKRLTSRFGVWLHHRVINDGVHDSGCTLKVYKASFVKDLELWGELHRYLPALLKLRGARVGEVVVTHLTRESGRSKYGVGKLFKGWADLWLVWFWQKYSGRPFHLFSFVSVFLLAVGFGLGLWAAYLKIWYSVNLSMTFLPHLSAFFLLMGVQLFAAGLLADIVIRNYYRGQKPYFVREIIKK